MGGGARASAGGGWGAARVAGWLATVARNLARNVHRGERRRREHEEVVARAEHVEPDGRRSSGSSCRVRWSNACSPELLTGTWTLVLREHELALDVREFDVLAGQTV